MTIAQQLGIKKFPFEIKNSRNQRIYLEDGKGFWLRREFDVQGNEIYYEDSNECWAKIEHDARGNEIRYEDSNKYWAKWEYDAQDNRIYFEDSLGIIEDKRPPKTEISMDEIAAKFGIPVSQLKIKK